MPDDVTLLRLEPIGIPPYSARGITQTYEPIAASIHLERDVNGGLLDLSAPQMRKYATKLTCTDQDTPALSGVWAGTVLVVDWIEEFSFLTANPAAQERTAVPGSIRIDGDFTFYRPRMTMVVMAFNGGNPEWDATVSWELDLEEE